MVSLLAVEQTMQYRERQRRAACRSATISTVVPALSKARSILLAIRAITRTTRTAFTNFLEKAAKWFELRSKISGSKKDIHSLYADDVF